MVINVYSLRRFEEISQRNSPLIFNSYFLGTGATALISSLLNAIIITHSFLELSILQGTSMLSVFATRLEHASGIALQVTVLQNYIASFQSKLKHSCDYSIRRN